MKHINFENGDSKRFKKSKPDSSLIQYCIWANLDVLIVHAQI